jgi:uncharacterized membrane protein
MSGARARALTVILALAGAAIAGYLTWVHYADIEPLCTGASECERVQASSYAEFGRAPVALIGLVGYAGILAAALASVPSARLVGAYLAFTGAGFSVYLTWVELVQIDAICQWCVTSAVLMGALAVIALLRKDDAAVSTLARASQARQPKTRRKGSRRASRPARASR